MTYEKVVFIGTGRVAYGCIQILHEHINEIVVIEPEHQAFSTVNALCNKLNIQYHLFNNKNDINIFFTSINVTTLVISAHNSYIFPPNIVENPFLTIVNFHNALLPKHRGRNAPTWSIYEMDVVAGITWHVIDKSVDTGDIVLHQSIPIDLDDTGFSLTIKLANLGIEAFRKIVLSLLCKDYQTRPQPLAEESILHLDREVPNKGIIDLSWKICKISAFLRSIDYGKLNIFPKPTIHIVGREFKVSKYRIIRAERFKSDVKLLMSEYCNICLQYEGTSIEMSLE